MNKQLISDAINASLTFLSGLVPGALGAIVSLAYEKTLTWTQRFLQLSVGIVVSYFAGGALEATFRPAAFVAQGFAFTVGMIAYRSTPRFIQSAEDTIAGIPEAIRDKIGLSPKRHKDDQPSA